MDEQPFRRHDGVLRNSRRQNPTRTTIRRNELAKVLSMVEGGQESAVLVVGEQGSGKSRLLDAIQTSPDVAIHRIRINPAEAARPQSGISSILASFNDAAAVNLSVRILGAEDDGTHRVDHIPELLSFFRSITQPSTLLIIDDIDLMDETSQSVIAAVASRLGGSALQLIASTTSPPIGPFASIPQLKLAPLTFAESMQLLTEPEQPPMSEAVRQIIVTESNGNPGALVRNAHSLSSSQLVGDTAIGIPFRVPRSSTVEDSAASIYPGLAARRVVLAQLSCAHLTSYGVIAQTSGVVVDALNDLLAEDTVRREGNHLRIRDPVLRSRVYWSLSAPSQLDYHAAAARAEGSTEPDLALWHRSWLEPARVTSDGLLAAATRFAYSGLTAQAIELAERALSLDHSTQNSRFGLYRLAHAMFHRGELAHAARYARLGQRQPGAPELSPELSLLRTRIEFMSTQQLPTADLEDWIGRHGNEQPGRAARALATIAIFHGERWELADAKDALERARTLQEHASPGSRALVERAAVTIAAIDGDPAPVSRAYDDVPHQALAGRSAPELLGLARSLTFVDRFSEARRLFEAIRGMEPAPHPLWLETARYSSAENEILAGNEFAAVAAVGQLKKTNRPASLHRNAHLLLMAWYWLAQDNREEAAMAIADCHRSFASGDNAALAARLEAYQGRSALMRGNLDEAVAFLRSTASFATKLGLPTLLRYQIDLIEAYVLSGRTADALDQFQDFRTRAASHRRPWTTLSSMRARALVAPGESGLALFEQAVKLWTPGDSQFELGRTLLSYGDRLSALGRATESREQHLAARIVFTQIGATSWAKKADTAHPAHGPGYEHPLLAQLSWDERAVVTLVRQGLRNKDIAAELFISLRTVEVRLTKIYQKLNVRSRAHLAAVLSSTDTVPAGEATVTR